MKRLFLILAILLLTSNCFSQDLFCVSLFSKTHRETKSLSVLSNISSAELLIRLRYYLGYNHSGIMNGIEPALSEVIRSKANRMNPARAAETTARFLIELNYRFNGSGYGLKDLAPALSKVIEMIATYKHSHSRPSRAVNTTHDFFWNLFNYLAHFQGKDKNIALKDLRDIAPALPILLADHVADGGVKSAYVAELTALFYIHLKNRLKDENIDIKDITPSLSQIIGIEIYKKHSNVLPTF